MSVQFGKWNFDGKPVEDLEKVRLSLVPYGPDQSGFYCKANIGIVFGGFATTKESRHEKQPLLTRSGVVIVWDGRLDNRDDLIRRLRGLAASNLTDVELVGIAYDWWGDECFGLLVGDWALSVWDPRTRSLLLAKDPIGTRHLYYALEKHRVAWSTVLDPLVADAVRPFSLCEEYVAGWLSFFPAAHLTPYAGINAVPPACVVRIRENHHAVSKYWDFDPQKRVRYRTDHEYEEHFRAVFGEAVRRRLRSDSPVLAELSGGMDSSSVVCMADLLLASGEAETSRLDTVSCYDDSEPNWNERPYFAKVEEKRGRTGFHIDVSGQEGFSFEPTTERFVATPGSLSGNKDETSQRFAAWIAEQGNRVVLSGTGGDEVTGGVPTPDLELQDLLARGHFRTLAHQLKCWALSKRKPWFHLFFEAARAFFPPSVVGVPRYLQPGWWLTAGFRRRNRAALRGYETRLKLFGPLPTFQQNIWTLDGLRRQLACDVLPTDPLREKRYPYLDRDLLEFLYAVPREQLVRPGERRSLMRRALAGIVPNEILHRRRKAYVARSPLAAIAQKSEGMIKLSRCMILDSLQIVNESAFRDALQAAINGRDISIVQLMRTLGIEMWLRNLRTWGGIGEVERAHRGNPKAHAVVAEQY
ncbi:MAG TPA: asparagine synthase-related protein [Terriglobales bacterium]|nr:asparagine synthase-related protein [Terriglobales bacterium]